jgi:hypothetical protein
LALAQEIIWLKPAMQYKTIAITALNGGANYQLILNLMKLHCQGKLFLLILLNSDCC